MKGSAHGNDPAAPGDGASAAAGDFAGLDLGMVRALAALVGAQSVSRAAEQLGQSQPQMSATLRRLRHVFNDPLLVRSAHGMVATEHALALLEPARRILSDVQTLLAPSPRFDAASLRRRIQIALPDFLSASLVADLMAAIRQAAPACSLVIRSVRGDSEALDLLESGQAELLIESSLVAGANVRYATLFEDRLQMVAACGHPALDGPLTLERYLDLPHVAAAPASGLTPGLVDRVLADLGLRRRVVAWVPYLNTLPEVLARTDFVFTTTGHLARHFASRAKLDLLEPPFESPPIRYSMMWHERMQRSGEHRWLRELLAEAARRSLAGAGTPATAA